MEKPDQIITFQTYYDPMLVHIIRTKLEDAGVPCFIADENSNILNPLYNQALGGIKIKIFARDLERCQAILAADNSLPADWHMETDPESHEAVFCPYCGSGNVKLNETPERAPGWQGLIHFTTNMFSFFTGKTWHCLSCFHNFD